MADFEHPFRLRILMKLTDMFAAISVEDGFKHDLADAAFRGRDWFGADDPIPMVSILEQPMQPDQTISGRVSTGDWELLVQGFVDDDPANPTDPAHMLLADVKRALAIERSRLPDNGRRPDLLGMGPGRGKGNEVRSLDWGGGVVRPPEQLVSAKAYFWLPVTLGLAENLDNPYA